MATASAPGKVYLFGEHAVVYGEPAVPCAIDRRATVTAEPRDDARVRIEAPALSLDAVTIEIGDGPPRVEVAPERVETAVRYVHAAIDRARDVADAPDAGFDVRVRSDLPIGAGLGSSAAVTVAAIDAATRTRGVTLDPDALADHAYRVERDVQGGQASRADTYCSAVGGAVRVEGGDCRSIEAPELAFVVGYDGGAGDTGELVAGVRELREDYGFVADTVTAIGDLVRTGEDALADGDLVELGRLMNVNHGLLAALGVSVSSLDAMAWAARGAGAYGAKLTGAGGGGCIVALDPNGNAVDALSVTPACERAFPAPLSLRGVIRE